MKITLFNREIEIGIPYVMTLGLMVIAITAFIGMIMMQGGGDIIIEAGAPTPSLESPSLQTPSLQDVENTVSQEKNEIKNEIKVYVVGCVNHPGIVTLVKGQLIDDAILAAGGATKEADLTKINLVYKLNDNVMLQVLKKDQVSQNKNGGAAGEGIKIIQDDGEAIIHSAGNSNIHQKININTASLGELDTLPGIGEKTATDIIAFRESCGGFKKIQDIMNVPRIGESKFNQIKELISVD